MFLHQRDLSFDIAADVK